MILNSDTRFGVKGLILSGERVLLLRKPNGEYDLPGGRLEIGERSKDGLKREILEETGLSKVEVYDWFAWWAFINRQGIKIMGTTWLCLFKGGRIALSSEHSGYTLKPLNELKGLGIFSRYALDEFDAYYARQFGEWRRSDGALGSC
ncbi:MAG: NUDIX domain-containing protein [Thermodesulfobacteriota bacterium]